MKNCKTRRSYLFLFIIYLLLTIYSNPLQASIQVVFEDREVAIYTENLVSSNLTTNLSSFHRESSFQIISTAWAHIKMILGPFVPSNRNRFTKLYIVFHNDPSIKFENGCSLNPANFSHILKKEADLSISILPVMHCDTKVYSKLCQIDNSSKSYDQKKVGVFDEIVNQLGFIVLDLTNQNYKISNYSETLLIKGRNNNNNNNGTWLGSNVSGWSMTSILGYCIYFGLRRVQDLKGWRSVQMHVWENFPRNKTYWFRDWYHPIYERLGDLNVLRAFFFLLQKHWIWNNKEGMNMGEWVHFWSWAAETSLRDLAEKTFGWNYIYQKQFMEAREKFTGMGSNYSCEKCEVFLEPSKHVYWDSSPVAFVVGISASIVIFTVVAFGSKILFDRNKMKRMGEQIRNLTSEEVNEFRNGTALQRKSNVNGPLPLSSIPFNMEYEISKEELFIDNNHVLGSGEYGLVLLGKMKKHGRNRSLDLETKVAVKIPKPNVDVEHFMAILSEIKILAYLKHHENIASLQGTYTANIKNREAFIALEYCSKGDLLNFLKNCRSNFRDLWNPKIELGIHFQCLIQNCPEAPPIAMICEQNEDISTLNLLEWACQIANGMAFLTSKQVIHADLAARNVLLTRENVAKISDFGLSRQLINYSNYLKTSRAPLPWRWLAIECLTDMEFSIQSDIWAFGVTLWEIFSLGQVPYPGRTWDSFFLQDLKNGVRVSQPEFGNKKIYDLILKCTQKVPMQRCSFQQSRCQLKAMKQQLQT